MGSVTTWAKTGRVETHVCDRHRGLGNVRRQDNLRLAARRRLEGAPLLGGAQLCMERQHVQPSGALAPLELFPDRFDLARTGQEDEHRTSRQFRVVAQHEKLDEAPVGHVEVHGA